MKPAVRKTIKNGAGNTAVANTNNNADGTGPVKMNSSNNLIASATNNNGSIQPTFPSPLNHQNSSVSMSNRPTSVANIFNEGNALHHEMGSGGGNVIHNPLESGLSLHAKIHQLERDLERRQESYITRERAYKMRIDELEEELTNQRDNKTGWMKTDTKVSKLKHMHSQILNNVELVQDRTARILQEQERDLLRAFRARLFDVQSELEKEKSKKDDGAAAWIERSRQLEAEVEWAKEVADRLERVNQTLLQENARLKGLFTSQEEDRNFLIKQLVAVKKDNARLRAEYSELENKKDELEEQLRNAQEQALTATNNHNHMNMGLAGLLGGKTNTMSNVNAAMISQQKQDSEERYKELNIRLRRLLNEERKSLQQVRQNYANELKIRTDMEMLLRQCVDDVRKEIARRYVEDKQTPNNHNGSELGKLYAKQPQLIPVEDFTQADRERVLELLLSQERVVSLIYAKTFPINAKHGNNTAGGNAALDATGAGNNNNNNNNNGGGTSQSPNNFDLSHLLGGNSSDYGEDTGNNNTNNNSSSNNRPVTANTTSMKLPQITSNATRTTSR